MMTINYKRLILIGLLIGATGGNLLAEGDVGDNFGFDPAFSKLEKSVLSTSKEQAVLSYYIANMNTPGFADNINNFDPKYQEELRKVIPDTGPQSEVMLEHFVAKLTENRSRYTAYIDLHSVKRKIFLQIATLGKR